MRTWTDEELCEAVNTSKSMSDVMQSIRYINCENKRRLGYKK